MLCELVDVLGACSEGVLEVGCLWVVGLAFSKAFEGFVFVVTRVGHVCQAVDGRTQHGGGVVGVGVGVGGLLGGR